MVHYCTLGFTGDSKGKLPKYEKNDTETLWSSRVAGGTHFYGILGFTAVQGIILDLSALNREKGKERDFNEFKTV